MSTTTQNHTRTPNQNRGVEAGRKSERFTPLFNDVFLKIFGSSDSAPVTRPLLNAILRAVGLPEIERVTSIAADASLPGGIECKSPRLDVVVMCDDGRLVDLEAERRKVDVATKSLFYAAKLLVENTPKSPDGAYSSVPRVVAVMLLEGSKLFPDEERFLTACSLQWDLGGRTAGGPDNVTLVVAELDKVRERYNGGGIEDVLADESLAWMYLLAAGYSNREEADRIMGTYPEMEEFAKRYGIALDDPDLKRAYDRWWMSEMEYNSAMETAVADGRKIGLAQGLEEGRKAGREQGIEEGRAEGLLEGRAEGLLEGRAEGLLEGRAEGLLEGRSEALEEGIAALRDAGLDDAARLLESRLASDKPAEQ